MRGRIYGVDFMNHSCAIQDVWEVKNTSRSLFWGLNDPREIPKQPGIGAAVFAVTECTHRMIAMTYFF